MGERDWTGVALVRLFAWLHDLPAPRDLEYRFMSWDGGDRPRLVYRRLKLL